MTLPESSVLAEPPAVSGAERRLPVAKVEAAPGTGAPDWPMDGLVEDMRPFMAACIAAGETFALVTLRAAEGGPRPVGTQMLVTAGRAWGFVSGGCVEGDVTLHARDALRDGRPRNLTYGRGSPFVDIRLPCGGRIELLVEPVGPGDPAILALLAADRERRPIRYLSDGRRRAAAAPDEEAAPAWQVSRLYRPAQRLLVIGGDPYALAIAAEGRLQGWTVAILRPNGPLLPPPLDVAYHREPVGRSLAALEPDEWTAVAVTTHDPDLDEEALAAALRSGAGYVGVLGSRRRLAERLVRLHGRGVTETEIRRLRSPIGLPLPGRSPREIAVGVIAEIIGAQA